MKVNNTEYLVTYPSLAITGSSLQHIDITKLLHSSYVMVFPAFIAASFSCCLFRGGGGGGAAIMFLLTSEFILLLPSWVTSSLKISELTPEADMQGQAMTLPPPQTQLPSVISQKQRNCLAVQILLEGTIVFVAIDCCNKLSYHTAFELFDLKRKSLHTLGCIGLWAEECPWITLNSSGDAAMQNYK